MNKALPIVLVAIAAIAAAALAADAPAQDAQAAGQVVMKLEKGVSRIYAAQISPDGKLLVYQKIETGPPGEDGSMGRRLYRLVLRELESGKETVLPTGALPSDDPIKLLLGNSIFDKDSKKIVVFVSDDANGDGVHDMDKEKLQAGVYDVASGALTKLGPIDRIVLPMFDGRGQGLVITAGPDDGPWTVVYAAPALDAPGKALDIQGVAVAAQPAGDLIAVVKIGSKGQEDRAISLVLFDAAKNAEAATLPIDPTGPPWEKYPPRFTADGRHLCWIDKNTGPEGQFMTRLWDVQAGKELASIPDALPLGPCKAGMLLGKGRRDLVLQELPAGATLSVRMPSSRPLLSRDKVLWVEQDSAAGEATLMMADVATLLGPPIAPATAPAPAATTEPAAEGK